MLDVPEEREAQDDVAVSSHGLAPEHDGPAGRDAAEDIDETAPEEAGYGYGV